MLTLTLPSVMVPDSEVQTEAGRLIVPGFSWPARNVSFDEREVQQLVRSARAAAEKAYAPFSRFHVGAAAVMEETGAQVFLGANVENSSYGGTICAERTALSSAAAAGGRHLRYLAVSVADALASPLCDRSPCGLCRQFIRQFCDPGAASQGLIFVDDGKDDVLAQVFDIERLLPWGFRFNP